MSKITLKPLDDGQKAVEIPLGKTTIGRGPFLGCSDKKVSRNHAVLEVTDKGEVFLTPTHVNPCFFQPTAESPGLILKKDIPHKLENGDSFSLLPRAFRYQLSVTGETSEDKNTDQSEISQQSEKTNGASSENAEEILNKVTKEEEPETSNGELSETTLNDKSLKEDGLVSSADKSSAKKENFISKKITDIVNDKTPCIKEDIIKEKPSCEKPKSPENHFAQKDDGSTSDEHQNKIILHDVNEENYTEDTHTEVKDTSVDKSDSSAKENDLVIEEPVTLDDEPKVIHEKVVEENESTLGHDSFIKENKVEKDVIVLEDDKNEPKPDDELMEIKETENEPEANGDGTEETNVNKDASLETNEETARPLPNWMEELPTPTKGIKKKKAVKQPRKAKQTPKKKPDGPKPKGRKKVENFEFDDGKEGNSQKRVVSRTSSRTNRQTRQGLSLEDFIVSDDDEWQSDKSEPKQRRKRGSRRADDSGSDWEVEHKKAKKVTHKYGSASESGSDWENRKKKKGPKGKRRRSKRTATSEAGTEDEADQSNVQVAKGEKRIPCSYGKKCFRRNQNHTNQFSHPGDSDYESETDVSQKNDANSEVEGDVNKKECPYGANCFRKNPQHKKDFKHTKKVRPQREAAKQADKKTKSSRNSDEVDSYDLNDSLLNEDSDEYKPVDSGSDYESGEKMKRFSKGKTPKNKRGKRV